MAARRKEQRMIDSQKKRRVVYRASVLMLAILVVAYVAVAFVYPWLFKPESELDRLTAFKKQGQLTFVSAVGGEAIRTVDMQVADDEGSRHQGLMGVKKLTDDQSMLFIFPDQTIRAFWMKYTKISLDIIFADSTGQIVTIHEHTTPMARTHYMSDAPAELVVEVRAGFCAEYGVTVGDRVTWVRSPATPANP